MPRPAQGDGTYLPALDGLRAVAVALVVGYHLGMPGLSGGLLGVGVFFTLSGFLITDLLVSGWYARGRTGLREFWVRRARRLLPALGVVLLAVVLATLVTDREALGEVLGQSLAAGLYVGNWAAIAAGHSYFDRFAAPGPLDHLWSLGVEEQFYLVWPLVLLLLMALPGMTLRTVARATGALAAASFALMWVTAQPGFDNTRAYEGTDTRAGGLLVGACLALVMWRPAAAPRLPASMGRVPDRWAVGAAVVVGGLVVLTDEHSTLLYHGGLLALSLATAVVLAVVVQPGSLVGAALGVRPLTWVGERSYGIYLWHLPVVAFTSESLLPGRPVALGALQVVLVLAISALSWTLVEEPVRRLGFRGAMARGRLRADGRPRAVPASAAAIGAVVLVAATGLSAEALVEGPATRAVALDPGTPAVPEDAAAGVAPPPPTGSLKTSCTRLVHLGDSTSIGLVDPTYQPTPEARADAQYARVGVTHLDTDISGGRSIVEHVEKERNAEEAVEARTDHGYDGCFVVALGTNEVANQAVGGVVPLRERIDRLMRHTGDRPVMWVTVRTRLASGPYSDRRMKRWNAELAEACERYPSLRVYDWRGEVKSSWFIPDGIHFTTKGYTQRAARLADALARAFPAQGPPPDQCLVASGR